MAVGNDRSDEKMFEAVELVSGNQHGVRLHCADRDGPDSGSLLSDGAEPNAVALEHALFDVTAKWTQSRAA